MAVLDDAVSHAEDGTWDFRCPGVKGSPCGDFDYSFSIGGKVLGTGTPFVSTGWPTKKAARARGEQHFDEHRLGAEILTAVREAVAEAEAARPEGDETPLDVDQAGIAQAVTEKSEYSPMQALEDFRRDQGLIVNDDGSVSVEDL